jgi:hypothetical protein
MSLPDAWDGRVITVTIFRLAQTRASPNEGDPKFSIPEHIQIFVLEESVYGEEMPEAARAP